MPAPDQIHPAGAAPEADVERYTIDEFLFWAKDVGLIDFDYDENGVSFWYFMEPEAPACEEPHLPKWLAGLFSRWSC